MNWKTTASGIATILVASLNAFLGILNGTPVDWNATIAAIFAGVGLIVAKDAATK